MHTDEVHDLTTRRILLGENAIEDKMGRTCGKHAGEKKLHTEIWWDNFIERFYLENLSLHGRVELRLVKKNRMGCCRLDSCGS